MIRDITKFQEWPPAGFDGQFHWEFLKGAFGPVIMPMDMDAAVERNGRFLVIETKHDEGVVIPVGQRRSLKALVKTGYFSVMVLYGKSPESITAYELWHNDQERTVKPADAASVYSQCADWYCYVNSLPGKPEYPSDMQKIIADLRAENSTLRNDLTSAKNKIAALASYVDRLEKCFKLESPKIKSISTKTLQLGLEIGIAA